MNLDRRLLRLLLPQRWLFALVVVLGLVSGVLLVLQAQALSQALDRVFLQGSGLGGVTLPLVILLGVIAGRALLVWGQDAAAALLAGRVKQALRERLVTHLQALGPAYLRGQSSGELVNTLLEGVESLDAYFSQYLPQVCLALGVPLALLAFVFPRDALSGVVLLVTAPLIPLFMVLIGSLAETLTRRQWGVLSRMSAYFLDVIQGLVTLKTLGLSRQQGRQGTGERLELVSRRFAQATLAVLRVAFLSALTLELVATLSTAVIAVQVGLRLLYGQIPFEQAFFVLVLAPEFYQPLRLLGVRFHAGMSGAAAAQRIFAILETLPQPASFPVSTFATLEQVGSGSPGVLHSGVLRLEEIHYTYPDGRPGLQGASLELAPGERLALVGASGAGKSTLAGVLLGLWMPQRGQLRWGELLCQAALLDEWRARIAYVSQEPYLFHTTVLENIRLARPEADLSAVQSAARLAQAHDFICALPQGYATVVGERGARLSRGQAQRIALARAFLKDAPLLVLDEPAANLDPETDAQLQQALEHLMAGRSVLQVVHRLGTAQRADRIAVMEGGRVVEQGTHAELLALGGVYARLAAAGAGSSAMPQQALPGRAAQKLPSASTALRRAAEPLAGLVAPALPGEVGGWQVLRRLLVLAREMRSAMALAVLLGFLTIASAAGLLGTSAYILAAAALHPSIAELQVAIVGVRFFGLARGVFRYLERYLSHQVTFDLLARWRVWFYHALEPLAPGRASGWQSGDLLARLLGDIDALENFYVRALAPPLVAILVALAAGLFMAAFAPALALALLLFFALSGLGNSLLARRLGAVAGQQAVAQHARLSAQLLDGIQGLVELLVSGQAAAHAARVGASGRSLGRWQQRLARLNALQGALGVLLAGWGMLAVVVVAIPLVSAGRLPGVLLPALALVALASFEAFQPLPQAFAYLGRDIQAARRLFEVVDTPAAVSDPSQPQPVPELLDLYAQDLGFTYPGESNPALLGVSFHLPPAKRIALVGASGAGKTTLLNLLLRFWAPSTGRLQLQTAQGRRIDVADFAAGEVRHKIAVAAQDAYLFNGTLRDNLLLARPQASAAELEQVLAVAQLLEWVKELPLGLDTQVGEAGVQVSGGERRRLALARALLQDRPLLLLDEPTANLDALTGQRLLAALDQATQGRSLLLVTHRLSGLECMDEILVLQAGRVIERGTHADLLARRGYYRRLWDLQQGWLDG